MEQVNNMLMSDRMVYNASRVLGTGQGTIELLYDRARIFLEESNIPPRYMMEYIDDTKLKKSSILSLQKDTLSKRILTNTNFIGMASSYIDTGYIAVYLMEQYATMMMQKDEHIKSILYIDTNLFIEDYKKLMDKAPDGTVQKTHYSRDVLYSKIFDADYVFWDKFSYIDSKYEMSKLYEILSVRYNNCLGNAYMVSGKNRADVEAKLALNRDIRDMMYCLPRDVFDFTPDTYERRRVGVDSW